MQQCCCYCKNRFVLFRLYGVFTVGLVAWILIIFSRKKWKILGVMNFYRVTVSSLQLTHRDDREDTVSPSRMKIIIYIEFTAIKKCVFV